MKMYAKMNEQQNRNSIKPDTTLKPATKPTFTVHMKNGQFNPGYNLRLGVEGEFIVTAGLFSERSDTLILLPLLEHF